MINREVIINQVLTFKFIYFLWALLILERATQTLF